MSFLQTFSYGRGSSPLHKLDPRSKMALVASIITSAILLRGRLEASLLLAVLSVILLALSGSLKQWLKASRGLSLLALVILSVNAWTMGLAFAVSMVLLLITLAASSSSFFLTTSPDDLPLALVKLKLPYELAIELSMAMRFIPTLAREAQIIIEAQQARGLNLKTSFFKRVKNAVPILVPLVVSAIRRSGRVAEAMESRCFGALKKRTWLFELRLKANDYVCLAGSLSILLVSIIYLAYST
ncbi:MAG: energy-coupling factor transporter transmembrane protein EcfT [Candidatus Nezhaarchaeota archaeon]|nr:energy-coupling factor transporter transmembrane protein EcfT [Candidatus Nezhaarchaeota archaeon]